MHPLGLMTPIPLKSQFHIGHVSLHQHEEIIVEVIAVQENNHDGSLDITSTHLGTLECTSHHLSISSIA
jgi:hypothetical protein